MKKVLFSFIVVCILFSISACSAPSTENRGDLSGLPSFEHQGYTYYLHNNIGKLQYSDAAPKVQQLSSFGYTSWFIPTIDELTYAKDLGLIAKPANQEGYWSSTNVSGNYNSILWYRNWNPDIDRPEDTWYTISAEVTGHVIVIPSKRFPCTPLYWFSRFNRSTRLLTA